MDISSESCFPSEADVIYLNNSRPVACILGVLKAEGGEVRVTGKTGAMTRKGKWMLGRNQVKILGALRAACSIRRVADTHSNSDATTGTILTDQRGRLTFISDF